MSEIQFCNARSEDDSFKRKSTFVEKDENLVGAEKLLNCFPVWPCSGLVVSLVDLVPVVFVILKR
jgi:hypothetical protein